MKTITPRVAAFATATVVAAIAAASGVFAAFSPTEIAGQICSGYGYHAGYGYGYDCQPAKVDTPKSTSTGGGGGGISSSSSVVTTVATNTTSTGTLTPEVRPSVVVFKDFSKKCESSIKDLTDARLYSFYNEINVINQSNVGRALTRAEFLKLVLNAAQADVTGETGTTYSDVPTSHSLYQYVAYATRIGMVSGQNGKFRPNDTVTRAEAAKIFVNAAGLGLSSDVTTFVDVPTSHSLATYIQTAYDNCLLHGRKTLGGVTTLASGKQVYEPTDNITLAETAKVLYNIVK